MKAGLAGARRVVTRRPWITSTVAVIVVGAGVGTYLLTAGSGGSTAAAPPSTRLVSVATGTVRQAVSTTGTFAPADERDADFTAAAKITSVRVTQGEKVAKGQVLGTIATVGLKATLAQARATLASAKASLADAEDSTSTTAAQLSADRASVTSARGAVTDATTALTDATLRSPIAGTVAEVNVTKGDTASGSGSTNSSASSGSSLPASSGTGQGGGSASGNSDGRRDEHGRGHGLRRQAPVPGGVRRRPARASGDFVVVGLKSWTVSASVDDTEVGLVSKGDQAQITTDNVTGIVFGTVSSVSVLSSSSSGSAAYPVNVTVTGAPSGLHDGASATVSIIYKQLSNVLTVATLAIHRDGTTSYVVPRAQRAQDQADRDHRHRLRGRHADQVRADVRAAGLRRDGHSTAGGSAPDGLDEPPWHQRRLLPGRRRRGRELPRRRQLPAQAAYGGGTR